MPLWEIITGRDCNMRCSYCYAGTARAQSNTAEQVVQFLHAAYDAYLCIPQTAAPRLGFIGGEPLLHPDLIDTAMTLCHDLNTRHHLEESSALITTNGTLISGNKPVLDLLEKWRGKLRISFSIDGTRETHDAFRVDAVGHGTWDRAIEGYYTARQVLGNKSCFAKATYSRDTVSDYTAGVIKLFETGFDRVSANCMFESYWPEETAGYVYGLFKPVMDYLLTGGRWQRKRLRQLEVPTETGMMTGITGCSYLYEGSMCLGLDDMIYGCHRAAVAGRLRPCAKVTQTGIEVVDPGLPDKARNLWKMRPSKCLSCSLGSVCYGCINSTIEDPVSFYKQYSPCGWTKGVHAARIEYARRVRELKGVIA